MKTIAICPACGGTMVEVDLGSCGVEFCREGCGGLWFDATELQRLDHKKKGLGPRLAEVLAVPPARSGSEGPRACPRCAQELFEERHRLRRDVWIDVCETCLGVFLEAGELAALRARPDSPDELRARRLKRKNERLAKELRQAEERHSMLLLMS